MHIERRNYIAEVYSKSERVISYPFPNRMVVGAEARAAAISHPDTPHNPRPNPAQLINPRTSSIRARPGPPPLFFLSRPIAETQRSRLHRQRMSLPIPPNASGSLNSISLSLAPSLAIIAIVASIPCCTTICLNSSPPHASYFSRSAARCAGSTLDASV